MSFQKFIKNLITIENNIITFIDECHDDDDKIYEQLKQILIDHQIFENKEYFQKILNMIANICNNHHKTNNFYSKIGKILLLFKDSIKTNLDNLEIFRTFRKNKRILLFLVKEKILIINTSLAYEMNYSKYKYVEYFSPEIKSILDEEKIDNETKQKFLSIISSKIDENFYENREKGQNETKICQIIQKDSLDDFIVYVNESNISLDQKIKATIFESNSFLIESDASLIEYSAFYGSIQIFQYLFLKSVKINQSINLYSIHGRNAEIITILENKKLISPLNCYFESIKCFHNDFAFYFNDSLNLGEDEEEEKEKEEEEFSEDENYIFSSDYYIVLKKSLKFCNLLFLPENWESKKGAFYYLTNYGYNEMAKILLKDKNIDTNFLVSYDDFKEYIEIDNIIYIKKDKKFFIKYYSKDYLKIDLDKIEFQLKMKYPCFSKIIGYVPNFNDNFFAYIYQYYPNGSLCDYLNKFKKKKYDSTELNTKDYILILGIAIGLKILQNKKIINPKFYPSKILIDDNFYPIFRNYLLLEQDIKYKVSLHITCGYYIYFPPEFFNDHKFNLNSNIYTFACIIYRIITRGSLLDFLKIRHIGELFYNFSNKNLRPNFSLINNKFIQDFLEKCLVNNPSDRLNIDEVIDAITNKEFCSIFNKFDKKSILNYLDTYGDEFQYLKNRF